MGLRTLTAEIDWHDTVQGTVSVRFDRFDGERCQYHYEVKNHLGDMLAEGDDLRSGSGAEPDLSDMLSTLLSFLGAAGESYTYPNTDRNFSDACAAWANSLTDELEMARADLLGRERAGY